MPKQLGHVFKQLERHVQQLGCMLNSSDKLKTVLLNGCKALGDKLWGLNLDTSRDVHGPSR